jgi:hypothetical protein
MQVTPAEVIDAAIKYLKEAETITPEAIKIVEEISCVLGKPAILEKIVNAVEKEEPILPLLVQVLEVIKLLFVNKNIKLNIG